MDISMNTVTEAARQWGVQESTVRRWVLRHRIMHVKIGRSVRIPAGEIRRVIEEGTVPAGLPLGSPHVVDISPINASQHAAV